MWLELAARGLLAGREASRSDRLSGEVDRRWYQPLWKKRE